MAIGTIKDKVAIIGMGCTKFGESWQWDAEDLIVDAAYEAYEDAGIDPKDIQAAWVGTTRGSSGATIAGPLKLDYVPVTRVENICATGADAFRNACFSIAAGMYDIVLVVGVEKTKDAWGRGGGGSADSGVRGIRSAAGGYANVATRYFHECGLTFDQGKEMLAKVAVKNHHNGSMNPKAHFQREITIEQVVKAPMIAWPLGLYDCCPTTDGAAAAVICRADLAKNFKDDYILVKGLGMSVGPSTTGMDRVISSYDFIHWEETERASKQAYEMAGIKNPRKEVSMAQVHDCFTISEIMIYEGLGLAKKKGSKQEIEAGTFTLEGEVPVNTDGGLKAMGHPIGASGVRKIYENYKQLQGKSGPRQVKNPKLGLSHSQGGWPGGFMCCITILGHR
ncbi:MAG: acetyl-CoA acetyltransferase [Chloroflexi bacterium]|nr:acetyl-CoA acetyltransferase [Chloroflexota bacterium]